MPRAFDGSHTRQLDPKLQREFSSRSIGTNQRFSAVWRGTRVTPRLLRRRPRKLGAGLGVSPEPLSTLPKERRASNP